MINVERFKVILRKWLILLEHSLRKGTVKKQKKNIKEIINEKSLYTKGEYPFQSTLPVLKLNTAYSTVLNQKEEYPFQSTLPELLQYQTCERW